MVSQRSGGAFDVTVGPLVRLWGFHARSRISPPTRNCSTFVPLIGYQNLVLTPGARRSFKRGGVELDLGASRRASRWSWPAACCGAGRPGPHRRGRQQYLVGHPAGNSSWQIGIDDEKPGGLLGARPRRRRRSTSGGRQSSSPAARPTAISSIHGPSSRATRRSASPSCSPDATLADALSKPAFILGPVAGLKFVESFPDDGDDRDTEEAAASIYLVMSEPLDGRDSVAPGFFFFRFRRGESTSACRAAPPRRACRGGAQGRVHQRQSLGVRGGRSAPATAWSRKPRAARSSLHVEQRARLPCRPSCVHVHRLEGLLERADAAGQRDETVGELRHQRLALVHRLDHVERAEVAVARPLLRGAQRGSTPITSPAGGQRRVGDDAHQTDVAAP